MEKSLQVQVLFPAPGRLAQLVRACGLHPQGRRFDPYSDHQMSDNFNYGATMFLRKLFGLFFVNPEFRFIGKILIVLLLLGIAILIFNSL